MTIKTKASHQLWLFKAKNCDLNVKLINCSMRVRPLAIHPLLVL